MGSKTIVYNTKSWEKAAELQKPKHPGFVTFTSDSKYIYIKSTNGTICVYDTDTFQLVNSIQPNKSLHIIEGKFAVTQKPFQIIDAIRTKEGNQLVEMDIDKGEYRIITDLEDLITMFNYHQYISAEKKHLFTVSYVNKETDLREHKLMKFNEYNKEVTLIKHPTFWYWDAVIYDPIHEVFIMVHNDFDIIILDSTFNRVIKKKTLLPEYNEKKEAGHYKHIHQSSDGKNILITYSEMVFILRYEDLETLVIHPLQNASFAEFSNDNHYILVGTWNNGFVLENNLE
ncbi:hypothetical protein AWH56_018400 [Anaerobacillus isosaccharinicus]|nr:hypothetical protein [Anaerobacillus isosaccharinicus]MBA5587124.1 hypothetical protein [Anaerobacillus isosaccharinicus]QOY34680.1 hypothetical protein AWH56_018400 [Anaerobacillus isosaccharinicus]